MVRIGRSAALAVAAAAAGMIGQPAGADDRPWGPGGYGPGMMGGYGPGMMMGQGGYGPGMMGGYGPGMMMGSGGYGHPCAGAVGGDGRELTEADVKSALEARLRWMGNDRLQVGPVKTADGRIVADIVTKDGALVDRMAVDPKTGTWRRVN